MIVNDNEVINKLVKPNFNLFNLLKIENLRLKTKTMPTPHKAPVP